MNQQLNTLGFIMNYIDQETLKDHSNTIFIQGYFMVLLMDLSQKVENLGISNQMLKKANLIIQKKRLLK
jgi:hypothetical protein